MCKRAVILAGGRGTRLKPYSIVLPKPLVPIVDYPILEIIIRQLARNGFSHITLTVNHLAEIIEAFFGNGVKWGVTIDYSFEDKPLSTMGPLKLIKDLPENFLVMNGDVLTDLNYDQFYRSHISKGSNFTISSYVRKYISEYGVLDIDSQDRLKLFKEKPVTEYLVSMGIYMVNRSILDFIPENRSYGFDNLMYDMLKSNNNPNVNRHNGYWLDIGRPEDYAQAIEEFEEMRHKLLFE